MLIVSPSPRELYAMLVEEERVAVDLLLDDPDADHARLVQIVGDARRLTFLRGLVPQLRGLGDTIGESAALDHAREGWEASRRRAAEFRETRDREREVARARDQAWLASLPAETRRAVERTRRRRARRHGGGR